MTNSDVLDTELLTQYYESLGKEGLMLSLETFDSVIKDYASVLQTAVDSEDEEAVRSQAHKIKGACRSVGLKALAVYMENIEKHQWNWAQAEQWLLNWADSVTPHRQQIDMWLEQKSH
ncbi:Hpt protein [Idiomarina fontislapidosi]|uniref:Histidine kinase n=1 Tax=Idiomarina fontislapidosi TaxID=263723 RepID=A0A432Y292_9GAMM|nr:Hpt domain-containing protein [Idiomarina fontislapidosi]PYE33225.1 Hpt protein [Idiomarina fontislapidosi]RUO55068.1 histidine kinase [Idiomarina fontislapidosi]|tara:strand:- start:708 stop:1061 length:354 start_codon:yes stop_codon:yes gene_type:complete